MTAVSSAVPVADRPSAIPAAEHSAVASAAVTTAFPLATDAGIEMLRRGGNAMDAAVAAAWALCVCEPSASGLGGHTVMLARFADGRAVVIEGASHAPLRASPDTITAKQQERGHRSCAVPSTAATLEWAQARYGRLDRARVMEPAIRIARDGYALTPLQQRQTRSVSKWLRATPGGRLFLRDGAVPKAGDLLRQPRLAATLERLRDCGASDFHRGRMARAIAADMRRHGGLLTEEDLAACEVPVEMEPIAGAFMGLRVLTAPPPSGGMELLLALHVLDELRRRGTDVRSEEWREAIALAVSAVFRDREHRAARAGTRDAVAGREPLTASYANAVADRIAQAHAWGEDEREEPGETTHLAASDRQGGVVLITQSIQSIFGAKVAHPQLGFLYNNYLCTCPRFDHPCALRPGARPRSNVAPTLLLETRPDGTCRPVLALGAAGSRRILSAIVQVANAVLAQGCTIEQAVAAPRVHGLAGRTVWLERSAASATLIARLHRRGRVPRVKRDRDFAMGGVQALHFVDGSVRGAADPRRDGVARTWP